MLLLLALPALAADGLTLTVTVQGLSNDAGKVLCAAYQDAAAFPSDSAHAAGLALARPSAGRATCTFTGLKAGAVAVSVYHDENDDGVLQTTFYGRPTEEYGFSNGARASMAGAPGFDAAAVQLSASSTITITLTR